MISTLISMQMRSLEDEQGRSALGSVLNRVAALGTVHRRLNGTGAGGKFDLAAMVQDLAPEIIKAQARGPVNLHLELEAVQIDNQLATPLGLIVNEIVTNAAVHAWPDGGTGKLNILLQKRNQQAVLRVSDDGEGTPEDTNGERPLCGLKLAEALVRQIRGTISRPHVDRGTSVEIGIPVYD